ncbi:MAG: MBL fold metallo-hydrolase [Parasphingorhabdus sp.]
MAFEKTSIKRSAYAVLLLLTLCTISPLAAEVPEAGRDDDTIEISLLGTGTPPVSTTQYGASTLIEAGDQAIIFDCGRGCGIRLMAARPDLYNKVDKIFLTHMHSDHLVGVADIYMNGWLLGRNAPLQIFGPRGTRKFIKGLRDAFAPDIYTRHELEGLPATADGVDYHAVEIETDGIVYQKNGLTVTAFTVDHAEAKPAYGYRVDYKGRSVMLSGDTRMTPNLTRYGKGVDVIIQEVIPPFLIGILNRIYSPEQAQKIVDHHTLASETGQLFARTNPRLAVYSHYKSTPVSDVELLAEAARYWPGPVIAGQDLMSIKVSKHAIILCSADQECRTIPQDERP